MKKEAGWRPARAAALGGWTTKSTSARGISWAQTWRKRGIPGKGKSKGGGSYTNLKNTDCASNKPEYVYIEIIYIHRNRWCTKVLSNRDKVCIFTLTIHKKESMRKTILTGKREQVCYTLNCTGNKVELLAMNRNDMVSYCLQMPSGKFRELLLALKCVSFILDLYIFIC